MRQPLFSSQRMVCAFVRQAPLTLSPINAKIDIEKSATDRRLALKDYLKKK